MHQTQLISCNAFLFLFVIFCQHLQFQGSTAASPCQDGWRYSPHSRKCYRFFNDEKWPMAELQCLFYGAHHASVHSKADLLFLAQLARGSETLWLGAAQFGASLDYVWTDHTPFDFENWPNDARPPYDPGRRCTKMNTRTQEWFQSCCKDPSPYVCEMKPSSPVTTSVDSYQYAYYSTTKPPYYNTYPSTKAPYYNTYPSTIAPHYYPSSYPQTSNSHNYNNGYNGASSSSTYDYRTQQFYAQYYAEHYSQQRQKQENTITRIRRLRK